MASVAPKRLAGTHLSLIGALFALAAAAWLTTGSMMARLDGGPSTDLAALAFYVVAWVLMMAAMMFPSIAPMVLGYRRVQLHRAKLGSHPDWVAVWLFVTGYLIAWTAFGVAAYSLFRAVRSVWIGTLSWDRDGRFLAATVITAAAAYELTATKDACLRRCRAPLAFLTEEWRSGRRGALAMGVLHGAWCVGCCWALMAALFAIGIMSVAWMAFVAALIALEKLLPWKLAATRAVAIVLALLAITVTLAPGHVPGLIVPQAEKHPMQMR